MLKKLFALILIIALALNCCVFAQAQSSRPEAVFSLTTEEETDTQIKIAVRLDEGTLNCGDFFVEADNLEITKVTLGEGYSNLLAQSLASGGSTPLANTSAAQDAQTAVFSFASIDAYNDTDNPLFYIFFTKLGNDYCAEMKADIYLIEQSETQPVQTKSVFRNRVATSGYFILSCADVNVPEGESGILFIKTISRVNKIRLTDAAGRTITISSFTQEGNKKLWQVALKKSAGVYIYTIGLKIGADWQETEQKITFNVNAPVTGSEITAAKYSAGQLEITVKYPENISKIQLCFKNNLTATYSRTSPQVKVEEAGKTETWKIKVNLSSGAQVSALLKCGSSWQSSDEAYSFTVKYDNNITTGLTGVQPAENGYYELKIHLSSPAAKLQIIRDDRVSATYSRQSTAFVSITEDGQGEIWSVKFRAIPGREYTIILKTDSWQSYEDGLSFKL